MDSNSVGVLLIVVAIGLFATWLATRNNPDRRRITVAAVAGLLLILAGLVALVAWPLLQGEPLLP